MLDFIRREYRIQFSIAVNNEHPSVALPDYSINKLKKWSSTWRVRHLPLVPGVEDYPNFPVNEQEKEER